jgi:homoserine O-succinyltransferase
MPLLSSVALSRVTQFWNGNSSPIVIGLVNSMPDTALRSTERQFRALLSIASRTNPAHLRLFHLPEVPRQQWGRSLVNQYYEDIHKLWAIPLDGLIVTGTEPQAAALVDEPYWPTLTRLIDWAEDHTASTIWSCLAAHSAVFHIDGIARRALSEKLSGIFDCKRAEDHRLTVDAPPRWRVPHSRYNGLPEETLVHRGYRVLSRSPEAGADIFVRHGKSLFVFFQGHPEYDPGALLREYRRDIRRFLAGERADYPEMPKNYFDENTGAALSEFRERVLREPNIDLLGSLPAVDEEKLAHTWREFAVQIYTNWLSYLAERKASTTAKTNAV